MRGTRLRRFWGILNRLPSIVRNVPNQRLVRFYNTSATTPFEADNVSRVSGLGPLHALVRRTSRHLNPDFKTRSTGARAEMIKTVFVGMETTQGPTGSSAQIRTNSTDACRRWLLGGRERSQGAPITAEFVLNSSVCVSRMANNVPVVATGVPIGNAGEYELISRLGDVTCLASS
jgi:hypothetical protein